MSKVELLLPMGPVAFKDCHGLDKLAYGPDHVPGLVLPEGELVEDFRLPVLSSPI